MDGCRSLFIISRSYLFEITNTLFPFIKNEYFYLKILTRGLPCLGTLRMIQVQVAQRLRLSPSREGVFRPGIAQRTFRATFRGTWREAAPKQLMVH